MPFHVRLHGMMNVRNAALAAVAARHLGAPARASGALTGFAGLADRQ
ncbi:MAG: hypothetical protein R2712_07505 [Vicinamibacterales bacterium]